MSGIKYKKSIALLYYFLNFILLLVPCMVLKNRKYSFLALAIQVVRDTSGYSMTVILQAGLLITYCIFAILYIFSCLKNRCIRTNILNLFIIVLFTGIHLDEQSMLMHCIDKTIGEFLVYLLLFITITEVIFRIMPEKRVLKNKTNEIKENAVVNQSKLFYRIIWKNFRNNWKDYLLILICNMILYIVAVIGFHMMQLLDGNYGIRKIQFFNGLSEILINAMIPMGILSMFLIIILIFFYLKMRAKNYGIFLTLGMYRKTLYYVTALEFGFVFVVSLFVGSTTGRIISGILVKEINNNFSMHLSLQEIGLKPYLFSIAAICIVYIISFMAAKDVFYDFNVGKSEDMRQIAEKMPGKSRYVWILVGLCICIYSILQYRKLYQFENEYLLLIFFMGLYLIIRNGMVAYLIKERKDVSYLKNLLNHNQLFHKSRTNTGFITVFTIIQFCILFYFSFQYNSVRIAEEVEEMFPYDFVCMADESDNNFFQELSQEYDIEIFQYPMVRVSAYDSTEKQESVGRHGTEKAAQGQHIGISESTYHELKRQIDSDYVKKDLKLDAEGNEIYVVYQQDKSVKAQPVSFYIPRNKALLHIGNPCRSFNPFELYRKEVSYQNYKVTGREIGSLIGCFRQGIRENVIVFSDQYFNKARELWKTVNIYTGEIIKEEEMRIPGVTIAQGVTKLVLIKAKESDIYQIHNELKKVNEKHMNIEDTLFKTMTPYGFWASGIYDSTVSYIYAKHEIVGSINVERIMKMIMSMASIGLFVAMYFMVMVVKMLSEQELNIRRQEFLKCMGMCRKERIALIRKEYMNYYCTIIYTKLVFDARIYTIEDIKQYIFNMLPIAVLYIVECVMIMILFTYIYAKRIEEKWL